MQQFSLPPQVSPGYELRARRIVFAPGGAVVEHAHADRPGVVYVLQGSMTEHRGDTARLVKAGDSWVEDAGTVHWLENTSDAPCLFVSVDLVRSSGPGLAFSLQDRESMCARCDKHMTLLSFWSEVHRDRPVDVFVTEPFDFDEEYGRALVRPLGPVAVRFVSVPSLIRMACLDGRLPRGP